MLNEDNSPTDPAEDNPTDPVEPSDPVVEPSGGVDPDDGAQDGGADNLILGKFKSQEELEEAYRNLESHSSKVSEENQRLRSTSEPKGEEIDPEAKKVIDQLRKYGFVTQKELERNNAVLTQAQKDDLEITSLGLTAQQEGILRQVAVHENNRSRSMTDIWKDLQSSMGGKVISKKTTIRPKAGNKNAGGTKELTPAEVAKLPQAEYDAYWEAKAKEQAETA